VSIDEAKALLSPMRTPGRKPGRGDGELTRGQEPECDGCFDFTMRSAMKVDE